MGCKFSMIAVFQANVAFFRQQIILLAMERSQGLSQNPCFRSYYPFAFRYPQPTNFFCYPDLWNFGYHNVPQILLSPQNDFPVQPKPPSDICSNPLIDCSPSPHENQSKDSEAQIENGRSESSEVKGKKKVQRKNEKWRQKYGRNILSNIFHMGIKKILSNHFSSSVEKIIEMNKMEIKENQFISKLNEKSRNIPTYISCKALQKIVVGSLSGSSRVESEYRKIFRTTLTLYLQYEHIPHIYSSGKIKKKSRNLHLTACRKLIQQLGRE